MQLARINIWHCFWFLGQGVLFSTLPWKTNPKQDVQIFSHLNIYFKEFLTSCVCLHFLPCCYFITQARLYMKRLRDHSEATKQTNVLPIQLHPACYSTARLGEGFRSTEGVTSSYLHTVFPFWDWGRAAHIHTGSLALWYQVPQVWIMQKFVSFQDRSKAGIWKVNQPSTHK